MHQYMEIMPQ